MDQEHAAPRGPSGLHVEENDDFAELLERAQQNIEEYVHEKPHAALGIAAGIGFVLGGGLTPRRLIRLGFAAAGPLLSRQIAGEVWKLVTDVVERAVAQPPKAKRPGKRSRPEAG